MATKRGALDQDPDYEEVAIHQNKRQKTIEKDGKEATKKKIDLIIRRQFSQEILNKEQEILKIDDRLSHCRAVLDRMRACIVARYYGCAGQQGGAGQSLGRLSNQQPSIHPSVKKFIGKTTRSSSSSVTVTKSNLPKKKEVEIEGNVESFSRPATPSPTDKSTKTLAKVDTKKMETAENKKPASIPSDGTRSSRFKVKKRIIVGNVSKYIPLDKREDNDPATHKWMVYVRGLPDQPTITTFVKKVWFFLHPSYRPNDLVEMSQYPFQLTRRGWGEFPIRVQLHFKDTRNKRVDIIHLLKLDKTYTGLQTLGAETTVDIEIEREDMPVSTITKPLPQATSTPVITQDEEVPKKRAKNNSACVNARKSLDSSGNSVDSDVHTGSIPKRCGSEISDTSMESDCLGGVFGINKQVTENGLKRTSSLSSNMSSSSELFSLDRRKLSIDDWSNSNSRVPSSANVSLSDMSAPTVSRGATPDFTSLKIKQEPLEETPLSAKSRKPKISLNLNEMPFVFPGGKEVKTEPFDMDDVGSTVTTPDSGIGIRPEPMDLGIDGESYSGPKIKTEIADTFNDSVSSIPGFESSNNESLTIGTQALTTPSVGCNSTGVQGVTSISPNLTDVVSKGVKSKVTATSSSPVVSSAQNLYIKCVDHQGNLCLIPQHLLMKAPQGSSLGKPVVSAIPTSGKAGIGQNVVKSPAGTIQMLIPTPGVSPTGPKPRGAVPIVKPTDSSQPIRGISVGNPTLPQGNVAIRGGAPLGISAPQKGLNQKLPPAATKLFVDPIPATQVVKPDQMISSRLKPPGAVSLLNRFPSTAPTSKNSLVSQPGLATSGTSRQPSPGKQGKGASVPQTSVLTLKNLSPNPPPLNLNSVPSDSNSPTSVLGQNSNILSITSQSSAIPSATGPPPTAQLVKANIGGRLVWLQLLSNQKPGSNKGAKALASGATIKTDTTKSCAAGNKAVTKVNADGNITITMGTGNYQATSQQKQSSLLKPGSQNFTIKNNSIFNKESGMKTLAKEQWVKYRQKRANDLKQAEKPVDPDNYSDFASLLRAVVRQYPLVHPTPDRSIHPYCAKNLKHFRSWNIGKRRAAEWQRASDIQNRIETLLKDGSTFKGEKIWTTKRIMIWCRHYLYTPTDPTHNTVSRKFAEEKPPEKVDSYTDVSRLMIGVKPVVHPVKDDDSDMEIIDVVETDMDTTRIKKEKKSPIKEEQSIKFYMPLRPEAEYIRDVAGKIGIQLKSVETESDVYSPVVEDILFTAMKQFTENILRNAARIKLQTQGTCEELTAVDVNKSINNIEQCDFLANAGLGQVVEKNISPSKPS